MALLGTELQDDGNKLSAETFEIDPLESLTSTSELPVIVQDQAALHGLLKASLIEQKVPGYNF